MTKTPPRPAAPRGNGGTPRWLIPVIGIVVLVVIVGVVVAVTVAQSSKSSTTTTGKNQPIEVASVVSVTGTPLPPFPGSGSDPAIGMTPPTVTGVSFNGSSVSIPGKGPAIVAFVAHWCPHCQREVPIITRLRYGGTWPSNVSLSGVSTAVAPERGNYPPSAWLESVGWKAPVLVDTKQGEAADAYGLTGFPYLVWTDASGKVVLRTSGEIPEATLNRMVGELAAGKTPALKG